MVRVLTVFGLCGVISLLSLDTYGAPPAPDRAADAEGGFIELFNGTDLAGWIPEGVKSKLEKGQNVPIWTVEDGHIVCAGWGFGFLRQEREWSDFQLHLEYRLGKGGNSGVGIRTIPFTGPSSTRPSFAAYEIQLLDDAGKPPNAKSTGSLYRYVAPSSNPTKPAGEWNTMDIECSGPKVKVAVNGVTIIDVDQATIPAIKDKPLAGFVSLQNHGSRVEFRDIRIRPLSGQ